MINSYAKEYFVVKFNGALPVTLEVLEKTGYKRYQLKIGHRTMSTKSLKPLKVGYKYWANFSQTREGMLSINNLKEKPPILQKEKNFLKINSWDIIDDISSKGIAYFKEWILNFLNSCEEESEFLMLTSMLLALNENIIHLPFMLNNRPFLLQWKINQNQNEILNENWIDFYFAFDTLGAIKGNIGNIVQVKTLYDKTANLIKNNEFNQKQVNIEISQDMLFPLWKGDDGLLDVKG